MKDKSKKLKLILKIWGVFSTLAFIIFLLLIFNKPDFIEQPQKSEKKVSKYLTHYLGRKIYNGAQRQEPFTVEFTEEGINELLYYTDWPKVNSGTSLHMPNVKIRPHGILIGSIVEKKNIKFSLSAELMAGIDPKGKFDCNIKKIKLGNLNITFLAEDILKRMYYKRMKEQNVDRDDIRTKLTSSIIEDKNFDPVFKIEDKHIRIVSMDFKENAVVVNFEPEKKYMINL